MNTVNDAFIKSIEKLKNFENENLLHKEIDGEKIFYVSAENVQQFRT